MDLSELRVIVIDEVDFFLKDLRNQNEFEWLTVRVVKGLSQRIQWMLFSVTFSSEVVEAMKKFISEAIIVGLKT